MPQAVLWGSGVSLSNSNVLIGAVSSNYSPADIRRWVETSNWGDCDRVLLVYNVNNSIDFISNYLRENEIQIIHPSFDFWGNDKTIFEWNTAECNLDTSYGLIHNIRFLHIHRFLQQEHYEKVLVTDVRDVYFNSNPFDKISSTKLMASSEEIVYETHSWNHEHLHYNLGLIGLSEMSDKFVYNVGVFGGGAKLVAQLCADIYLMSIGKHKVADQTSFNYLINTRYKPDTEFTDLSDKFAVHLHVINEGAVKFDLTTIPQYSIVHQYDRLPQGTL